MSTLVQEPILGIEIIQQEILLLMAENLNGAVVQVNDFMAPRDQQFAARLGRPYVPVTVESVAADNFVDGHRPSLIDAPITNYPNCSVWVVRTTPTPESAMLDQLSAHRNLVYIEVMVKSEASEEEVNRRMIRMVEGVNLVVMSHQTVGGVVHGLDSDPAVTISEVFTRKERSAYGPHWFWQGARLEYAVRKEAVHPSSSSGSIFRAAGVGNSGIDYSQYIDQG